MERLADYTKTLASTPKGRDFARLVIAMARYPSSGFEQIEFARKWIDTPQVHLTLEKAGVPAGSTMDPDTAAENWGAALARYGIANEFIELLATSTVVDRMAGARRVPARVSVPREISPLDANWIGQGSAKPISAGALDTVRVDSAVIAALCVISKDLVKMSRPGAEPVVTGMLLNSVSTYQDMQMLDPSVSAVPDANPASLTYGAATHTSSGTTAAQITADLSLLVKDLTDGDVHLRSPYLIMRPRSLVSLSLLRLTDTGAGPSLGGIPILTSTASPSGQVTLVDAAEILVADEGQMRVATSDQVALQIDDSPTSGATSLVSLWQHNLVGIKVERRIAWTRAKDAAVSYLTSVAW